MLVNYECIKDKIKTLKRGTAGFCVRGQGSNCLTKTRGYLQILEVTEITLFQFNIYESWPRTVASPIYITTSYRNTILNAGMAN